MSNQSHIERVEELISGAVGPYVIKADREHLRALLDELAETRCEAEAVNLYRHHFERLTRWMGDLDGEVWRSGHDISERVIARCEKAEAEREALIAERDDKAVQIEGLIAHLEGKARDARGFQRRTFELEQDKTHWQERAESAEREVERLSKKDDESFAILGSYLQKLEQAERELAEARAEVERLRLASEAAQRATERDHEEIESDLWKGLAKAEQRVTRLRGALTTISTCFCPARGALGRDCGLCISCIARAALAEAEVKP